MKVNDESASTGAPPARGRPLAERARRAARTLPVRASNARCDATCFSGWRKSLRSFACPRAKGGSGGAGRASDLYGAGERCASGLYGAGERCASGLYRGGAGGGGGGGGRR